MTIALQSQHTDIAVIGAGVVGLCCAHELQRRGDRVLLIDASGPGAETSFGNAGSISIGNVLPQATPGVISKGLRMLADPLAPLKLDWPRLPDYAGWLAHFVGAGRRQRVLAISAALSALNRASREAWLALCAAVNAEDLLADSGYLHVYSEPQSFIAGRWERKLMRQYGVGFDVLDRQQLLDLEPGIGAGFAHAVFQRDALAMRDPGGICLRLAFDLQQRGAGLLRARVSALQRDGSGYRVLTDQGVVSAGRVVIAAGAWSNRLLQPFGVQLPIVPARGYHLMFTPTAPVLQRPTLWAERYMVISPQLSGVRVTSIKELTALDRPPRFGLMRRLAPEARRIFPALPVQHEAEWSGNRPCTPDSLPIIDQLPDEQIFLATGHGHLGLTQAPITGRLLSQLMANETPDLALTPYRWNRF